MQYRKALEANQQNPQANYNLGCALMMQQKDSAAVVQYEKAARIETNKIRRSKAFHNIGIVCQNHQMYGDAIKAYEESLRLNPTDNETRYNLALCKKLNKNQQNQNNQQQQQPRQQAQKPAATGGVCPECGKPVASGAKFCPECGAKLNVKKFCPECGAEVNVGAKFCPECGTKL